MLAAVVLATVPTVTFWFRVIGLCATPVITQAFHMGLSIDHVKSDDYQQRSILDAEAVDVHIYTKLSNTIPTMISIAFHFGVPVTQPQVLLNSTIRLGACKGGPVPPAALAVGL